MDEAYLSTIFDGHNDTLLSLYMPERGKGRSFFERSDIGHLDLPRAREGGFGGGFFAIFVPAPKKKAAEDVESTQNKPNDFVPQKISKRYAQAVSEGMMALLLELEKESGGQVQVVRNSADLANCLANRTVGAIMHFEGAEAIASDLSNLESYYGSGLRSIGITWSRPNEFGYGVPFKFPHSPDTGPGLTLAGKELVRECNRLGIMLDLSHLNEQGFWDVAKSSKAPLVATHSGVHAICQASRNLTDKQLDAIADSDGLVGINFHVGFLRSDGKDDPETPISEIVRHINYVVDRIGINHVALGSDFDGATMPVELGDVAGLPKLTRILQVHGYDEQAIRKIGYENWQRALSNTWQD